MRKIKGQSLVEVTVALSILAIAMMGVITLGVNVIGYTIGTKARTQAMALAQQGLEIARDNGTGCGTLENGYYYEIVPIDKTKIIKRTTTATYYPVDTTGPFASFQRQIGVRNAPAGSFPATAQGSYKLVTAEVQWQVAGTPMGTSTVYGLVAD